MRCFLAALLPLGLLAAPVAAQPTPRPDSTRVVVLPDVAVSDHLARLVLQSGKPRRSTFHLIEPAGANAIRFLAPRSGYHALSSVRVNLFAPGSIREGALRVRLASVAADGSPAEDNLLPAPVLLATDALRQARRHLTINWPANRVVVPENGFFIVLEGVGNFPDEYTSRFILPGQSSDKVQVEIRRRADPAASPRLAYQTDFPAVMGATPATAEAENWVRDTVTRQWRRQRTATSVAYVEALFE